MKHPIILFFCCTLIFSTAFAQQKSVLFIGNSYTYVNDLPLTFHDLSLSGGDSVSYASNTAGGYTFQLHSTNATTIAKINSKPWDFVVLQEQSQIPAFPPQQVATDCYPYAKLLDSLIHVNNACTQTVFYMTWGRKYGDASNCASYPPICTYNGMTGSLRQSYVQMADDNQALVAPCGMAWKASRAADSMINLWSSDNSHPSVAGTYLTACTFYATIFKKSPVGLPYISTLPQQTATFLQQIAHNTVFDSLSTWNINEFTPKASYTITDANGYNRSFSNTSTHSNQFIWNFGDGATSTQTNPSHIYPHPGDYYLSLIAADSCRRDTLLDTIHIARPNLAWQRANLLSNGINLSYLENYWAGNAAINYTDYLHHLADVSTYKDDIALMKEMGFETLRLPICFDKWENGTAPYTIDSVAYFSTVDSLVKWANAQNMNVIIDYHHGRLDSTNFLTEKVRIQSLWTQIATHFANTAHDKVFFELYNEPYNISTEKWKQVARVLITSIRAVDADRTLIVGGTNWNGINGLENMGALPDSNVIYSFHYYEPMIFTHQGATWVGNPVSTTGISFPYNAATMPAMNPLAAGTWGQNAYNYYAIGGNATTILSWLSPVKKWTDSTELPIFCGEWGSYKPFIPKDGSRCRYTETMKNGLDSMQIPFAYWEWDGGFSLFDGAPSLDSLATCMADVWGVQTSGIEENTSSNPVLIYPNPSKDILIIETKENFSEFILTDINGKTVMKSPFQRQISVESLASGCYFLTLKGEKGNYICKIWRE